MHVHPGRRLLPLVLVGACLAAAGGARAEIPNLTDTPAFDHADIPNLEGKPNTITISAYDPSLKDNEILELALAKQLIGWGKRGDIGLYFPGGLADKSMPGGRRYFVVGAAAEEYIKKGAPLRGMTAVGMPVDDYGSAIWAKNVSVANTLYAHKEASGSPVFRSALKAVAKANPALQAAAKRFNLNDPELFKALNEYAQGHPSFAVAWATLARESVVPTAFVVHGFGMEGNDTGAIHYGVHKRQANELGRATDDKVVAGKVSDLMVEWWKKALPQAKESGLPLRFFTANHCAGTYEDSDWLQMLSDKLNRQDPKLAAQVMHRIFAYDLGAGANKPAGVHHVAQIGARDMFGHINTPTRVMARADIVDASHMLNTGMGRANPDGLVALKLKAFNEAFGLPNLFDSPAASRAKKLQQVAVRLKDLAAEKAKVRQGLDEKSPPEDKRWDTYKMSEANLKGHEAIYKAKAARAEALANVMELRGKGASKDALAQAWAQVKQIKRQEQELRVAMDRKIIRDLGLSRGTYNVFGPMFSPGFWTNTRQYQGYVHGEQPEAMQRHLEKRLDAEGMKQYAAKAKKADALFKKQLINFYGRVAAITKAVQQKLQEQKPQPQAQPRRQPAPAEAQRPLRR